MFSRSLAVVQIEMRVEIAVDSPRIQNVLSSRPLSSQDAQQSVLLSVPLSYGCVDAWIRSVWYPGGFTPDGNLSGGSCKLLFLIHLAGKDESAVVCNRHLCLKDKWFLPLSTYHFICSHRSHAMN